MPPLPPVSPPEVLRILQPTPSSPSLFTPTLNCLSLTIHKHTQLDRHARNAARARREVNLLSLFFLGRGRIPLLTAANADDADEWRRGDRRRSSQRPCPSAAAAAA